MPSTGFLGWLQTYGPIFAFFVQIVFWIVVAGSAAWAAVTFARYVKYMTTEDDEPAEDSSDVSVEEFVE